MAMEDARHYCKQHHGDLVTINSEAENIFLWKQVWTLTEGLVNAQPQAIKPPF